MSKKYPCPAGREDDCGYPACAHDKQCELAASTCFSDHAVAKARRERLRECLETLSVWCERRAGKKYNTDTTITMLSRKVQDIMDSVAKAGRRGLDEYNQQKNSNH